MKDAPLSQRLIGAYDDLSPQMKLAARFILDRPRDVALLSMREQARLAGVRPATMTRLAQQLDLEGYDAIRALYADAVRDGAFDFARQADRKLGDQKMKGDQGLAAEMAVVLASQVAHLAQPDGREAIAAAAECVASGRRIYCLGMRSSFAAAWHFHYVLSLVREGVILLDGMAGTGIDSLRNAASDDVLLAVSISPYTRATVEAVDYASSRGVRVIAITDSAVSPIADAAEHCIHISTESPSFFHAMAPAFAAAEILASVVAGRGGTNALATLEQAEAQLNTLEVHFDPRKRRKNI
ncbi:MurR/RpiR family transcriptional regulator [Blastomonas sp.]|uniref:MurR/RpiR family transcriptional regulator n=1 Tax=Blastomonas sp. TaxID=1909299 RepID=UPI00262B4423|nr:MurR/RpiR family transcriptional regulator [Blastomonas sp.]MDM7955773.1 MurR/RpiR family transcriptional regulator [Blastomonas sp.]